jgi:membrane-bound serine protease (ClpP class)
MGRREAVIALADELAVAIALVTVLLVFARELGVISTPTIVLVAVSIVFLFGVVGYLGGKAQLRKPETGLEALIGKKGIVVEDLDPEGLVIIDGEYWKAVSISGDHFSAGEEVVVKSYQGLVLHVDRAGTKKD